MWGLILSYGLLFMLVLIEVMFITLIERKVLSLIQLWRGPSKVGFKGLMQPLADGGKLVFSELISLKSMSFYSYYMGAMTMMSLMLMGWLVYPIMMGGFDVKWGLLFFMCYISVGVYLLLGCGWSSSSKYALIGAVRGLAQAVSYEAVMVVLILSVVLLVNSYDLIKVMDGQSFLLFMFILWPVMFMMFVCGSAENNRAPFYFAEGESELVSGFNVENGGSLFALVFIGEYGSIMLMSMIMSFMFTGWLGLGTSGLFMLTYLWCWGTLSRFHYDSLMYLAWSVYLPVGLNYLLICVGFMCYCSLSENSFKWK